MEKHQILEHIRQIEEEELQESRQTRQEQLREELAPQTPTTALVPVSHQNTPPIIESTILLQDPPLPDEEAEPITDIPLQRRRRGSFFLLIFSGILLFSIGLYFLLPILFPSATVTIVPMQKKLTTTAI